MINENTSKIITISNTKGGCGKSTLSILLLQYFFLRNDWKKSKGLKIDKIAFIDFDYPQFTTNKFYKNRKTFFQNNHYIPEILDFNFLSISSSLDEIKNFIEEKKKDYNYIVIDSGGHHDGITSLSIELADILITPVMNTIFDISVLFSYDKIKNEIQEGEYTKFVKKAKNKNKKLSWFVVQNKCSSIYTPYQEKCSNILKSMSNLIGFNLLKSFLLDRQIYSIGFDNGLTCFDDIIVNYYNTNFFLLKSIREEISNVFNEIFLNENLNY